METKKMGHRIVVRLDKGEEVLTSLKMIAEEYDIHLASVQALGATNHVTVGLLDIQEKKYYSHTLDKDLEITSLIGNITRKDQQVYLHLHINVADMENHVFGGHLNECIISATCEMFIDVIDGEVTRKFDEVTGLNLFEF